jgi:hypothetical protein
MDDDSTAKGSKGKGNGGILTVAGGYKKVRKPSGDV